MHELMNVLYVNSDGAYVRLESDTLRVQVKGELKLRVPLIRLSGLVCIGNVLVSPAVFRRFAEMGGSVALLDRRGRFKARVQGAVQGNVLLRRAQHLALSDSARAAAIMRQMVAGKIQNCRQVLLRAARDAASATDEEILREAAERQAVILRHLHASTEANSIRGREGEAAQVYFAVFENMIRGDREVFAFGGRTRRPPRDRTNAVLSFLYTLVREECNAGLEGVGLDPQVGYLHTLRPGRPSLALDLMEELRPVLADRLTLTLINRRQLSEDDFEPQPGGGVFLNERGRRTVITAYQTRKTEEVRHPVLDRKVPIGLIPHVQARLLARHLRGDLPHYPPFQSR